MLGFRFPQYSCWEFWSSEMLYVVMSNLSYLRSFETLGYVQLLATMRNISEDGNPLRQITSSLHCLQSVLKNALFLIGNCNPCSFYHEVTHQPSSRLTCLQADVTETQWIISCSTIYSAFIWTFLKQVYFQKYTTVYSYMVKTDSWWHTINHEEVF